MQDQVAQALLREARFRRFLVASALLHIAAGGYAVWTPRFAATPRPLLAVVMVEAVVPTPAPPATPPPPAPPEPKAPEPEPEPQPVKPTPPQQIEEAVVIPPVPREKPREKPKPPPVPTPDPKPEPAPRKPPPPPPPSAQELIQAMRDRVGQTVPVPESGSTGAGDPELAEYQQRLLSCFYSKWIGVQRFRRRRDLQVEFEVRVAPDGAVVSADKVRASGEPVLDDSAERAIQRCSPLPPPPAHQTRFRFIFVPGDIT